MNIPKQPALVNKIDDINKLVKRSWTELELAQKLNRQNTLRQRFSGADRDRLVKQVEDARQAGNEELLAKLQDELDRLEVPRLAFKTSLTPTKKKPENASLTQQERLAVINAENRRRNNEMVRKAQLKERQRAREYDAKTIERGNAGEGDSTRRAKTRLLAGENGTASGAVTPSKTAPGSGASTPANGTPRQKPTLPPHIARLQAQQQSASKSGIPTIHKPLMDDDIIGALDLDIDIEID